MTGIRLRFEVAFCQNRTPTKRNVVVRNIHAGAGAMILTGRQIREGRELLCWSRADLARNAFLSLGVVEVVEDYGSTFMLIPGQMAAIVRALGGAGIEFVFQDVGQAVRLRKVEKDPKA